MQREISQEEFIEILKEYKSKVTVNTDSAIKFLTELEIIDENCNLTERYKNLQIPE